MKTNKNLLQLQKFRRLCPNACFGFDQITVRRIKYSVLILYNEKDLYAM